MTYDLETFRGVLAIHVHPNDDLIQHDINDFDGCICGPELEYYANTNAWVVVHHSLDGREYAEN